LRKVADAEDAYRREQNGGRGAQASDPSAPLNLNGAWYTTDPKGAHGIPSYTMYPDDLKQIMRSIRDGKEQSDFMMLQVHAHPTTGIGGMMAQPPDYLIEYAHDAIDNGADTFVATGPHQIGGIEIYKGKPIFYGLASIVYTILNTPVGYDRYRDNGLDAFETDLTDEELNWAGWPPFNIFLNKDRTHLISGETILPKSIYQDGRLVEIDVTPVHFGYGAPMSQLGIPHVATGEVAQRILSRLQELSKPYGTKLEIKGDIGVIKVSSDGKSP
jgi:poly-gamma-glutamate synthesis protein (capsule biosynthesis protein)